MGPPESPPPGNYTLFYDAVCPLCTRWVESLSRRGLLDGVSVRAVEDAEALGLTASEVDALRSELLLRDANGGESLRGFDGILKLLELHGKLPWLRAMAAAPGLRAVGRAAYRMVAYHRRAISPPATHGAACACDPPPRPGWKLAFYALCCATGLGGAAAIGAALSYFRGSGDAGRRALEAILAGAVGWLASVAAQMLLAPRRGQAILEQAAVLGALGGCILLPFAAAAGCLAPIVSSPRAPTAWGVLALGTASCAVLSSALRRYANLGVPRGIAACWLLLPAAAAAILATRGWFGA